MMHYKNLKTRFDVCVVGGNYTDRLLGPLFAFEDVNYYDMNVSGSDGVAQGMNFRIIGKIDGFNSAGKYIILKPISLPADNSSMQSVAQFQTKNALPSPFQKLSRAFLFGDLFPLDARTHILTDFA